MSTKNKQAKRAAQKLDRTAAEEDEPVTAAPVTGPGKLLELGTAQIIGSCLLKYAPKMPHIMQKDSPLSGDAKLPASPRAETKEQDDNDNTEETTEAKDKTTAEPEEIVEIFSALRTRLTWHNAMGLAEPQSGAEATALWMNLKAQELDMGPRKSKRGTPKLDRILANLSGNFIQYVHILLFGFMLNAFLFRSWFSCLPWLFAYQIASLMVPLETIPAFPQVPLSAVPLKFRVAVTMAIHGLLWFFFFYEAVWRCNFFIEFLLVGAVISHAYVAKPDSSN